MLDAYARSGLSLLAFAQTQDMCYASLRRWRSAQAATIKSPANPERRRRHQSSPGFVPVQVEPPSPSGEFSVSWPGGRTLRIPSGFDPDELRRLLWVLEARS